MDSNQDRICVTAMPPLFCGVTNSVFLKLHLGGSQALPATPIHLLSIQYLYPQTEKSIAIAFFLTPLLFNCWMCGSFSSSFVFNLDLESAIKHLVCPFDCIGYHSLSPLIYIRK